MEKEVQDREYSDTGRSCCSKVIICVKIATVLAVFAALGLAIDNHVELKNLKAECMREVTPSTNTDTEEQVNRLETQLQRMMDRQDTMLKQLTQLDTRYNIINESIRSLSSRVDEGEVAIRAQIDILSASHTTLRAEVNTSVSVIRAELSAVLADFEALGVHFNTLNVTALSAISQLDSITTSLTTFTQVLARLDGDLNTHAEVLSGFSAQVSRLSSDLETTRNRIRTVFSDLDVQSSRLDSLNSRIDSTNNRINNYHSSVFIPRPSVMSIFITMVTAYLSVY